MKQFVVNFENEDVTDADVIEAVDSIPGKHRVMDNNAHWIRMNIKLLGLDERTVLECSRCRVLNFDLTPDDYCRHCGAKMHDVIDFEE